MAERRWSQRAPPGETGAIPMVRRSRAPRLCAVSLEGARSNAAPERAEEELRRTEAEGQRLVGRETTRVMEELAASASHALRTPLNSILAWAQILAAAPPSPETVSRATASLFRNVHAHTRMLDDLLDVSRILMGTLHVEMAVVDLRSAVQAAWDGAAPAGRAKRLNLSLQTLETPAIVHGDQERLQQMVGRLLANAVTFTPEGGSVSARLAETDDGYSIRVADTGIGIELARLPHVFERFRRADTMLHRGAGGLRLGLVIVAALTELHGGTVRAESEGPALGSAFTITLPAGWPRSSGATCPQKGPASGQARAEPDVR